MADVMAGYGYVEDSALRTLRLQMIFAGRVQVDSSWKPHTQFSPYARLYYCESGKALLWHSEQEFRMEPGHIYLIPANRRIAHHCDNRAIIPWCRFTASVLGGLDLFDYLDCRYEVECRDRILVERNLARLRELYGKWEARSDATPPEVFEADGILRLLLVPFLETVDQEKQNRREVELKRYQPAIEHIRAHMAEPLRLSDLARLAHLEATYFSHQFKKHFAVSPVKYIRRQRVEAAQRRLWETNDTLSAIAAETGFSGPFHLSKAFKQVTGETPSSFRRCGRRKEQADGTLQ